MNQNETISERVKHEFVGRHISSRKVFLMGVDWLCLMASCAADAFLVRNPWPELYRACLWNAGVMTLCLFLTRLIFAGYANVWRYANVRAYLTMMLSDALGGALAVIVTYSFLKDVCYLGVHRSILIVALFDLSTLGLRLVYQQWRQRRRMGKGTYQNVNRIRVAIVGAGRLGVILAEELHNSRGGYYMPVCFVDIDHNKVGGRLCGLPVYAEDGHTFERLHESRIQEVFIAIPGLTTEQARQKQAFYAQSGCKIKLYDTAYDRRDEEPQGGDAPKRTLREIRVEDLLARDTKEVLDAQGQAYYRDRVVLVTGGGGSIGSELCRQVARCHPRRLIIFDIYENNAYDIQQELIRRWGDSLNLSVEIGSVRDEARLDCVFAHYRPDVVFHAAAHKHVPLMEHSSCEAVKNNVLGTYQTANAAEKYGVQKFILVSTDKAVNPTNVMGASKRLCEMVIQCRGDSATSFAAVRFGNVLGSNGSVIPLFRKQLERGGPLTVTHRDVVRYFMTIPEASQLVMTAGAMAAGGELFVLNMGRPVKILSLAENMIRLAGMRPYQDIDIVEVGLRPGEKLFEELLLRGENPSTTANETIFVEADTPLTRAQMDEHIQLLRRVLEESRQELEAPAIREALHRIVPTFREAEEVNRAAAQAEEMKQAVSLGGS